MLLGRNIYGKRLMFAFTREKHGVQVGKSNNREICYLLCCYCMWQKWPVIWASLFLWNRAGIRYSHGTSTCCAFLIALPNQCQIGANIQFSPWFLKANFSANLTCTHDCFSFIFFRAFTLRLLRRWYQFLSANGFKNGRTKRLIVILISLGH